jgi:hypothetical protein
MSLNQNEIVVVEATPPTVETTGPPVVATKKVQPFAGRYKPEYYQKNREKMINYSKKWASKNNEKVKQTKKNYYNTNEEYRQRKIIQMREHRIRKKEEKRLRLEQEALRAAEVAPLLSVS